MLFCLSSSGWEYASDKAVAVTSKNNGGKVTAFAFTFTKAIDAIKNNDVLLKMCCAIAKGLTVANERVVD